MTWEVLKSLQSVLKSDSVDGICSPEEEKHQKLMRWQQLPSAPQPATKEANYNSHQALRWATMRSSFTWNLRCLISPAPSVNCLHVTSFLTEAQMKNQSEKSIPQFFCDPSRQDVVNRPFRGHNLSITTFLERPDQPRDCVNSMVPAVTWWWETGLTHLRASPIKSLCCLSWFLSSFLLHLRRF